MRTTRLFPLAGLVLAGLVAPRLAPAQDAGRIVVTPYVGAYVPTANLTRATFTEGSLTATADVKQQTAAAASMNVSFWLDERFALEGGVAYASSKMKSTVTASFAPAQVNTNYANVWLGSAKLMMRLLPSTSSFNVRLGVGPAIISRGGSAYASDASGGLSGLTDLGGVASLCTRIPLGSVAALRVRAEDYLYSAKFKATSVDQTASYYTFASRTQNDLVFSVGLQLFANR